MREKMRPCLKKNPTMTKAIFLMRINKDDALSDDEMEAFIASLSDSSAASERVEEEEEDG